MYLKQMMMMMIMKTTQKKILRQTEQGDIFEHEQNLWIVHTVCDQCLQSFELMCIKTKCEEYIERMQLKLKNQEKSQQFEFSNWQKFLSLSRPI
uniref:Uncharacterized protein n=1 Tax=Romanomermis culicivorax TaxID=13658 RepID=A0A915JVD2_ROMCU